VTNDFALFDKPTGVLIHPQNRHTPYSLMTVFCFFFFNSQNL